jgi:hypothetical protein
MGLTTSVDVTRPAVELRVAYRAEECLVKERRRLKCLRAGFSRPPRGGELAHFVVDEQE